MTRALTVVLLPWLLALGCSSTREVYTTPPRPARPAEEEAGAARQRAEFSVLVETGETPLPEDVQALRFRIEEIRLRQAAGEWTTYPADAAQFEIRAGRPARKIVLATRLPPARYDSLALTLADVFVLFDANAGAPLTLPRDTPLKMALPLTPTAGTRTTLRLTFQPGASLMRTSDGRWFFLPFFEPSVD
jgi:hypothetical protein